MRWVGLRGVAERGIRGWKSRACTGQPYFARQELRSELYSAGRESHTPTIFVTVCCSDDNGEQRSPDNMNCIFRMLLAMLYTYVSPLQGR